MIDSERASQKLLLVEDDERLADLTARYLRQNGYEVITEARGDRAVARFRTVEPDLVVLDLMLPGMDGLDVCAELRKFSRTPVLMLTAKDADLDQVVGLSAGADDYVVKPVEPMVLLARVQALLRRVRDVDAAAGVMDDVVVGGLCVSQTNRGVTLHGEAIELSTQEFGLLWELARNAGSVLSREALFRAIRGIDYDGLDRSIDVRVSRLRKKLGDNVSPPKRIKTVWGKGYLLVPDAWQAE